MAALPYPITPDPEQGFFDLDVPEERLDFGSFMEDRGWRGFFTVAMVRPFIDELIAAYEREHGPGSWEAQKLIGFAWPGVTAWAADVYEAAAAELQVSEFRTVLR